MTKVIRMREKNNSVEVRRLRLAFDRVRKEKRIISSIQELLDLTKANGVSSVSQDVLDSTEPEVFDLRIDIETYIYANSLK